MGLDSVLVRAVIGNIGHDSTLGNKVLLEVKLICEKIAKITGKAIKIMGSNNNLHPVSVQILNPDFY